MTGLFAGHGLSYASGHSWYSVWSVDCPSYALMAIVSLSYDLIKVCPKAYLRGLAGKVMGEGLFARCAPS